MLPGDRFKSWIDETASGFADRLATWGMGVLARGATKALEDMEPGAIAGYRDTLIKLRDNPDTPPELRAFIDKAITPGNPFIIVAGVLLFVLGLFGMINALSAPINRAIEYKVDRGIESFRLDPLSVITAWRRDPEKYAHLFDDLEEQGWSDSKIEALKFFTEYMPTPQQVIAWLAHEVFEPEMIARYGLDDEFEGLDLTIPRKIGMSDEMSLNEWRNHWQHASWTQVVEMLHRGQLEEKDVWEWFRLVEIPSFWRDKLIATAWAIPTRVDVRRFFDLKTIDEARLREIYTAMGYHGKDLDDYVLWTKIYVDLPDLLARWKNGWITLDEVRERLIADGMDPDAADELIQTKVKAVEPTSTAEGKELTKAEIYKGVKTGVITYDQGVELVQDLDYTRDQAEYLLAINVAVLTGSPGDFKEFKDLTWKYRKTVETMREAMTEELKRLAGQVAQLTGDLDNIRKELDRREAEIVDEDALPAEARDSLNALRTTLLRTGAELERVKADYQRQLAVWRQRAAK